jgi:hypothetical protein
LKSIPSSPDIIKIIESLAEAAAEGPLQSLRILDQTFYRTQI